MRGGGRVDALKYALGANAIHGQRRSNADKRRCVEIAVAEFPKMSSRAIAELCGVSHPFVESIRPSEVVTVSNATRTTSDGRQYPATRRPRITTPEEEDAFYFKKQKEENKRENIDRSKLKRGHPRWERFPPAEPERTASSTPPPAAPVALRAGAFLSAPPLRLPLARRLALAQWRINFRPARPGHRRNPADEQNTIHDIDH